MHVSMYRFGIQPSVVGGDGHDRYITGVYQQEGHDDGEVRPMCHHDGKHRGDFDHPGDGVVPQVLLYTACLS